MSVEAARGTFGPGALATPANALTLGRILSAPLVIGLLVATGPSWVLVGVWTAVSLSDGLDGWIARRQGATRSGAFLDPLADKVAVLGALVALAATHRVPWVAVVLIAVREVSMSVYRSVAGRRGVSIPARFWAKVKTFVQDVAVGLAFMPVLAHHRPVYLTAMWVAVGLTLATGVQYLVDGRRAMAAAPPAPPAPPSAQPEAA